MVFTVPQHLLDELAEKMASSIPKTLAMVAALHNVKKGKLTAIFYTDEWPNFSAVVCQILSPRISDVADIVCYATSKEALLQVLNDAQLVTWDNNQHIECVESDHADYLLEHLQPPNNRARLLNIGECCPFYLPGPLQGCERVCPSGYTVGKLIPSHAELVASYWSYFDDWPNKVPYFEALIRNYHNVAIYSLDNPDNPVAWNMVYPYGQQAHLYTMKEHRRKGLATVIKRNLCRAVMADGLMPECQITVGNAGNSSLVSKLGFVKSGTTFKWLVVKPYNDTCN